MLKSHLFTSIGNMFQGFSAGTTFGKILIAAGSTLAAIYSPITALLITCFAFTAVDMFYGIKLAKKLGKKIESHKNWKGTITKLVDEFVVVSEKEISLAIAVLSQRAKCVVEGAGASTLAAVLFHKFKYEKGENIVCVLSGGNITLKNLAQCFADSEDYLTKNELDNEN